MRLERIEDGIAEFYGTFRLSAERAELIRDGVLDELAASRQEAARSSQRAKLRIARLNDERSKLLTAHYAGAVPLDMLKGEMDRLTAEMTDAEAQATAATREVADVEGTLTAALEIAEGCEREYLAAEPRLRRLLNQGFFKALYIGEDCSVERFEMTEPFATLLDRDLLDGLANERASSGPVGVEAPGQASTHKAEGREGPSALGAESFTCPSKTNKSDGGAVRLGLHKIYMVRHQGLEPRTQPRTTTRRHRCFRYSTHC